MMLFNGMLGGGGIGPPSVKPPYKLEITGLREPTFILLVAKVLNGDPLSISRLPSVELDEAPLLYTILIGGRGIRFLLEVIGVVLTAELGRSNDSVFEGALSLSARLLDGVD